MLPANRTSPVRTRSVPQDHGDLVDPRGGGEPGQDGPEGALALGALLDAHCRVIGRRKRVATAALLLHVGRHIRLSDERRAGREQRSDADTE